MLLSIGMIVKNEEKFLERCLKALKPILDNVDSELIIADTGSTDNTVEIAKKFTDNVFYFEWINDFAAARNSTLERAKGEWFMFIDADEIFQSCDEIIEFFNSGEYKQYNAGTYTIRNYSSYDNPNEYNNFYALRLFKRLPDLRFVGTVHETFNIEGRKLDCKTFGIVADHYGYAFSSDAKLERKKAERNIKLLEELEKNEPFEDHQLLYSQFADCYIGKDNQKALDYIEIGMEKTKAITSGNARINYYSRKAQILFRMARWNEVIEVCDDYFSPNNTVRTAPMNTDIEMQLLKAEAYCALEQYSDAFPEYVEFFRIYNEEKNGKIETTDKLMVTRVYSVAGRLKNILLNFAVVCIYEKKYATLDKYLHFVPIQEHADDHEYVDYRINLQLEIMDHIGYKNMQKFYNALDEYGKKSFSKLARIGIFVCEKREEFAKAMSALKTSDSALKESFALYKANLLDNKKDESAFIEFGKKYGYDDHPAMVYFLMDMNSDITPVLSCDSFYLNTAKWVTEKIPDMSRVLPLYDFSHIPDNCLDKAAEMTKNVLILRAKDDKPYADVLEKYIEIGTRCRSVYENSEDVPKAVGAAIALCNIAEERSRKDYKQCVADLRQLLKEHPDLAAFVKKYQQEIKDEAIPPKAPMSEFEMMAFTVKNNIKQMINAGNVQAAAAMLDQLKQLCPNDPEVDQLYKKIGK